MNRLFAGTFVALALAGAARAQSSSLVAPGTTAADGYPVASTAQLAAIPTLSLPGGPWTVATLPACSAPNAGKVAYVTDLGGGADNVVCSSGYWKHIRLGTPASNASTGTVTLTPLSSAPIQVLTGSSYPIGSTVNIAGTNLYPGEMFYVKTPSTLGGLVTSLGISLAGTATGMTQLANTTYLYIVSSTLSLVQLQP